MSHAGKQHNTVEKINLSLIHLIALRCCSFPNRTPQTTRTTLYHLEVDGDSLMRIPPVNQTVQEHNTAMFDCMVKEQATMSVTWLKDGKIISMLSRCIQHPNGSLTITETLMNDLGFYECRVKRIFGGEESARAFLNVQCKHASRHLIEVAQFIHIFSLSIICKCR